MYTWGYYNIILYCVNYSITVKCLFYSCSVIDSSVFVRRFISRKNRTLRIYGGLFSHQRKRICDVLVVYEVRVRDERNRCFVKGQLLFLDLIYRKYSSNQCLTSKRNGRITKTFSFLVN